MERDTLSSANSTVTYENSSVTGSNGLIGMNNSSLVFFIIGLHDFTGVITVIRFADNSGGGNVSGVLFLGVLMR